MLFILGILDILTGLFFASLYFWNLTFIWIFIIYLIIKNLVFFSIAGIVDIIAAFFMILALYGYFYWFSWIFVIWLLQKGVFSLFKT